MRVLWLNPLCLPPRSQAVAREGGPSTLLHHASNEIINSTEALKFASPPAAKPSPAKEAPKGPMAKGDLPKPTKATPPMNMDRDMMMSLRRWMGTRTGGHDDMTDKEVGAHNSNLAVMLITVCLPPRSQAGPREGSPQGSDGQGWPAQVHQGHPPAPTPKAHRQ
jgi:hypothetical protein